MVSFQSKLKTSVVHNNTLLCIGLDNDLERLPQHLKGAIDPLFEFNKAIVDSTADLVCAYKPNSAFYESSGDEGLSQLKKTCDYIGNKYSSVPIILDAKRADIGTTNNAYARYAFEYLGVDAITVHPYLGREALEPFLAYKDKGIIVLCRTSNPGAGEFQDLQIGGKELYKIVARNVKEKWNSNKNCLLVVGATYPEELAEVRQIVGNTIDFLIPGVGAQGGDLEKTLRAGLNSTKTGLIISSSREIIFASDGEDFAHAARRKAVALRDRINKLRSSDAGQ